MSLRSFVSKGYSGVYKFRYENPNFLRENGKPHFREITVSVAPGRFARASEAAALEIAERRLSEAYGQRALEREARVREGQPQYDNDGALIGYVGAIPGFLDPAADKLRLIPDAHQDGYELVSVERVR